MSGLKKRSNPWLRFFFTIIFPTLLAIILSVAAIYLAIIPAFSKSFLDDKKEMILELTNVAWSVLEYYHNEEQAERLTRSEAQEKAIGALEFLRYGDQNRDYFWIMDETPRLLMHPYSKELLGIDLGEYTTSDGKKVFKEIKQTVAQQESGFIDYSWNKKYEKSITVPKLSYVRRFSPWQWVVGTGVFLDDVERKTVMITERLSRLSFITVSLITLLLLFVGRQSYTLEWKRKKATADLRLSQQKYKRLVEVATDPILMIFGGKCIYSNKPVWALTQYSQEEFEQIDIAQLFSVKQQKNVKGENLAMEQAVYQREGQHEVMILCKDNSQLAAVLDVSMINLGGKEAVVLNIQESSGAKGIEQEFDENEGKYRQLLEQLNIGTFRLQAGKRLKLLEASPTALSLFETGNDFQGLQLQTFLKENKTEANLYTQVLQDGIIKNKTLFLRSLQRTRSVSISLTLIHDSNGKPLYCDGMIEDISEHIQKEQQREKLIVELQTSLLFLNQPIQHVQREFSHCSKNDTLVVAARKMAATGTSSILIEDDSGEMIGIVTDKALREKVVAEKLPYDTTVSSIMSAPLIFIEDSALIFEASLLMEERRIKHLVVKDSKGSIVSVISNEDLLNVHRYSSAFLIQEIGEAESIDEVIACHERLPRIIKALVDSGAHARNISKIVTTVSDVILGRLIDFTIEEIGEPPTRFAFISLGSEGREEQSLATDQDNALIYEDVEEEAESIAEYYHRFSTRVCTMLDQAGYAFCTGEIMAMNPKWCQPLSKWQQYYSHWVTEAKPQDLMEASIFFDFRCMYGDRRFTQELRQHIRQRVANRDVFFYQLAQNALLFRLPVDFFGNISVESGGEHANTFNIKYPIALIVGYARLYAINFSFEETNTLERLELLRENGFIAKSSYEEIREAYNYLMQIRFKHQVRMINKGLKPDNHITLEELSFMEKSVLKKIFSQVGSLQKRLNAIGKVEIFF